MNMHSLRTDLEELKKNQTSIDILQKMSTFIFGLQRIEHLEHYILVKFSFTVRNHWIIFENIINKFI